MRQNILLEFSAKNNGNQGKKALDMIEDDCKSNWFRIVEWARKGQKIRVLSTFSEIMDIINTRRFTKYQKSVIQYKRIEN